MNSIPVLGTEPASEKRIRSCCGSMPGIRFYCKPVTLVRCWEIRGENRFSGRVGGKWLCEMTSAFIIKELRGARALRLNCGRSAFPPPFESPKYPPFRAFLLMQIDENGAELFISVFLAFWFCHIDCVSSII
jgi:hypothetical protein